MTRAGQPSLKSLVQTDVAHEGHEQQEAAQARAESAWRQAEDADSSHRRRLGANRGRPLVVAASGQARAAFLAQEQTQGVDADSVAGGGELALASGWWSAEEPRGLGVR